MEHEHCPSVSPSGLDCDKEDCYATHMSLTHRNNEAEKEWTISKDDKMRWETDGGKVHHDV